MFNISASTTGGTHMQCDSDSVSRNALSDVSSPDVLSDAASDTYASSGCVRPLPLATPTRSSFTLVHPHMISELFAH